MARLNFNQSVAAGDTYRPCDGWQYEYAPFGGIMRTNFWTTATGVVVTVTSGSDTIMERSPIDIGSAATGNLPSELDVTPVIDEVAAGDRLKIQFENTTGGALVVSGWVEYNPG